MNFLHFMWTTRRKENCSPLLLPFIKALDLKKKKMKISLKNGIVTTNKVVLARTHSAVTD